MSMYHSLELRVPFLDHKLVEYVTSLPTAMKLSDTYQKQLLVDAIPELPKEIYNRPKMGFTFPFQQWLNVNGNMSNVSQEHWSHVWAKEVLQRFYE